MVMECRNEIKLPIIKPFIQRSKNLTIHAQKFTRNAQIGECDNKMWTRIMEQSKQQKGVYLRNRMHLIRSSPGQILWVRPSASMSWLVWFLGTRVPFLPSVKSRVCYHAFWKMGDINVPKTDEPNLLGFCPGICWRRVPVIVRRLRFRPLRISFCCVRCRRLGVCTLCFLGREYVLPHDFVERLVNWIIGSPALCLVLWL